MPGYLVRITLIVAFVQFINALEYMIFNPYLPGWRRRFRCR